MHSQGAPITTARQPKRSGSLRGVAGLWEIREELFELAVRFDRMAAAVEKRRRIAYDPHYTHTRWVHREPAPEG
jgi:hypothetical protein